MQEVDRPRLEPLAPAVLLEDAADQHRPALGDELAQPVPRAVRRLGNALRREDAIARQAVEVRSTRSMTLALRWLVGFAQDRREKTMTERLMNEILDASNGLGAAVKRREDMHKMAESNRAFALYRW